MDHTNCSHCRASLPAPRSRLLGGLVVGLAYVVLFVFGLLYACLGPLGLMFLPFFLPGAIGAITSAHSYASSGEFCPACGKLIERKAETIAPRPGTLVAQT